METVTQIVPSPAPQPAPQRMQPQAVPYPVPPAAAAPPSIAPARRSTWWIVPVVIVGLILVAWLLLAGLPFGGDDKRVVATATTETIAEGTVTARPVETGTVVEVGQDDEFATETAPPPPLATATQTVPTQTAPPATQTQPVIVEEPLEQRQPSAIPAGPRPIPRPQPVEDGPAPRPAPAAEISESEASAALRGHLAGSNPYDGVSGRCMQLRSIGYRNVGYTFAVWDACVEGGGSRMLGRWRVDAKTREVFRQGDDGRYLKP